MLYSVGIEKRFELSVKAKIKKTWKSREELQNLEMPDDPRELTKALFEVADRKLLEKKLRQGNCVI